METKGILRVVLVIVSSLMMLGSLCDNGNKGSGNPLEPDPNAQINVGSTTTGITFNSWLDFGEVEVGKEVSHQLYISNLNKWPGTPDVKYILWLDATSPSSAPFSLSALNNTKPCAFTNIVSATLSPSTLKSGEVCYFDVVYKPDYEGTHMAKITIQSNDPDHQEEYIFVKGYGVCSPNNLSGGCAGKWPTDKEPSSDPAPKGRSGHMDFRIRK